MTAKSHAQFILLMGLFTVVSWGSLDTASPWDDFSSSSSSSDESGSSSSSGSS